MIKKVAIIMSLFLVVDRFMYYKLGQFSQQEKHLITVAHSKSAQDIIKKKRMAKVLLSQAKKIMKYATDNSSVVTS